jgi:hypothetical protein
MRADWRILRASTPKEAVVPHENGADMTAAEKQEIVTEAYREWEAAHPKPLGDGRPSAKTMAYNQLANVCHELGVANPADDERARERVDNTMAMQTVIERLRRQAAANRRTAVKHEA